MHEQVTQRGGVKHAGVVDDDRWRRGHPVEQSVKAELLAFGYQLFQRFVALGIVGLPVRHQIDGPDALECAERRSGW